MQKNVIAPGLLKKRRCKFSKIKIEYLKKIKIKNGEHVFLQAPKIQIGRASRASKERAKPGASLVRG